MTGKNWDASIEERVLDAVGGFKAIMFPTKHFIEVPASNAPAVFSPTGRRWTAETPCGCDCCVCLAATRFDKKRRDSGT